jgi:hypothetical protein
MISLFPAGYMKPQKISKDIKCIVFSPFLNISLSITVRITQPFGAEKNNVRISPNIDRQPVELFLLKGMLLLRLSQKESRFILYEGSIFIRHVREEAYPHTVRLQEEVSIVKAIFQATE